MGKRWNNGSRDNLSSRHASTTQSEAAFVKRTVHGIGKILADAVDNLPERT